MKQDKENSLKIILFLAITTCVVYWKVTGFDFVGYDDAVYITENPKISGGLSLPNIWWAFSNFYAVNWHPLTLISHFLDYELYGMDSMGHHWTNVQFHIVNTLLLFYVLKQLTGAIWRSCFVAGLFALHPLHVESVAWVSERKDLLSTFFWLLTILTYYYYVQKRKIGMYLMTNVMLCLSLMAKPMAVTLPFVLLLLDFWPLKRCEFSGIGESEKRGWNLKSIFPLVVEKWPLFLLSSACSVITYLAQKEGAVRSLEDIPAWIRIGNAFVSYAKYLLKTIWPANLAIIYPHPGNDLSFWAVGGSGLLLISILVLAIKVFRIYPYIIFGLLWYIGTLVPVIGIVQVGDQAMADRYTYIPLIGVFVAAIWGLKDIVEKSTWVSKKLIAIVYITVIFFFSVSTYNQLNSWKDGISLFEHAVKVTKNNWIACNNLGAAYLKIKNNDTALENFYKALEIKNDYALSCSNIGLVLYNQEKYHEAAAFYEKAVMLDPDNLNARLSLGNVFFQKNELDRALNIYDEAIKISYKNAQIHNNMANIWAIKGNMDKAVFHLEEALKFDPDYANAHYNLGNINLKRQKYELALNNSLEAIKHDPNHEKAYNQIGLLLACKGEPEKALKFFNLALRINPTFAEARRNIELFTMRTGGSVF